MNKITNKAIFALLFSFLIGYWFGARNGWESMKLASKMQADIVGTCIAWENELNTHYANGGMKPYKLKGE